MRAFILLAMVLFFVSCQTVEGIANQVSIAKPTIVNTIHYDIAHSLTLINAGSGQPEKQNIWVALIGDHQPYQQVVSRTIQPENYVIVIDEYGNQYAEFDFGGLLPGDSAEIRIDYEVAVNQLTYDLASCSGAMPADFTAPELHIESDNPQIVALAEELSTNDQTACEMLRAFYDYIGQNLVYTYNGSNWGAQAALGTMGADCTEYSSLLIALSRSKGIPARYVEGLLYLGDSDPLEAHQEHAWVEVYFPGTGWAPVDPTLGRSQLTGDAHFARYTPNHIIVTYGRSPSTLRGASYWSHLYWPGESTDIRVQDNGWTITLKSTAAER